MNLPTILAGLLIAAVFAAIVGKGIYNRRHGKGGCSCGRDCGACGAPNCRAFAEDTVRNRSCGAKCPLYKEGDGK